MTPERPLRALDNPTGPGAPISTMSVFADLHLVTDEHRLQLVGDGRSLVLHSSDPRRLAAELRRIPRPAGTRGNGLRAVGYTADTLRDNGISVAVRGPAGTLVHLGSGRSSRLGALMTGSPAVSFGTPHDLAVAAGIPVRMITAATITLGVVAAAVLGRRLASKVLNRR